jgi:hypothetical protein
MLEMSGSQQVKIVKYWKAFQQEEAEDANEDEQGRQARLLNRSSLTDLYSNPSTRNQLPSTLAADSDTRVEHVHQPTRRLLPPSLT